MRDIIFSYDPFSFFYAGHCYAAVAALTMPIAIDPETASLKGLVLTLAAEECSAVKLTYAVRNRPEEANNDVLFAPAGHHNSP